MLSAKEVRRIGTYRFWNTGIWGHYDLWATISLAWFIIVMCICAAYILTAVPDTRLAYTIPSSVVEEGKDINIVSEKWKGYTVNGYLLKDNKRDTDKGTVAYLILGIALIPMVGLFIISAVGEHKSGQYADYTVQKWVDTKEI